MNSKPTATQSQPPWFARLPRLPLFAPKEGKEGGCTCGYTACNSPGKHPRLPWNQASSDPRQIMEWGWKYPGCNWGVVLRPEGKIVVIDIDPRNGGERTIQERGWSFPRTPTVNTGGGGKHLYYFAKSPIQRNTILGPGVELKVNGVVVVPPSLHPSGLRYAWSEEAGLNAPLAALPDWVLREVARQEAQEAQAGKQAQAQEGDSPKTGDRRIREGERNTTLTSIAGRLRRKGWAREEIESELKRINRERCSPPLPEREIETIAKSIARYPAGTTVEVEAEAEAEIMQKDYGHAAILAELFRDRFRWATHRGSWLRYDGKRWTLQPEEAIAKEAAEALRNHYARLLAGASSKTELQELAKKIQETCIYARITGALNFLKGWGHIMTQAKEWDSDPWFLNLTNGTLDLRAGTLRPHDPKDLITKLAPIDYDPHARGELWDRHISRFLPNPNIRRQVQRDLGRALPGVILEESLPIWYGQGANGKTTTARVLRKILGDYAGRAAPNLLVQSKYERHPTEIADLFGLRLVFSVEIEQGKRLAEALVKELTGGDELKGRYMRQDFFGFDPSFSIFLIVNHKPIITGDDDGIWRRIRLIPWEYSIPQAERRPQEEIVEALTAEGPAILNWLLDGLKDWQQDHHWTAEEVRAASDAYRAEMDILGEFLRERCELGPRFMVAKGELYEAYTAWCTENHERILSKKEFTGRLRDRGIGEGREGNKRTRIFIGIRLRTHADT